MKAKNIKWWIIWLMGAGALGGFLATELFAKPTATFLPGATTSGHYQIELACTACHKEAFEGREALQRACVECHGAELKRVEDSHPRSKFTDPRNADRTAILDARYCVTCHREHVPDQTRTMAVTLPDDFCSYCHQKIAKDRPSHQGMTFDTCANGGCHNFHDNKALYEEFLVKHVAEPVVLDRPHVPARNRAEYAKTVEEKTPTPLALADADGPRDNAAAVRQWSVSAHARGGVNCTACHQSDERGNRMTAWNDRPAMSVCKHCHGDESTGFVQGKHGMRIAQKLPPMSPAHARQPMKADAKNKELTCNACHGAHNYDTRRAAVDTCMTCHDDEHTRNFKKSPHYKLWLAESAEAAPAGSGVSCATCHMAREHVETDGFHLTVVQHNQNDTLRPNEKMVRSVCMQCHGLGFALDALADPALVANNFQGKPAKHIESIEMAQIREEKKRLEKASKQSESSSEP